MPRRWDRDLATHKPDVPAKETRCPPLARQACGIGARGRLSISLADPRPDLLADPIGESQAVPPLPAGAPCRGIPAGAAGGTIGAPHVPGPGPPAGADDGGKG